MQNKPMAGKKDAAPVKSDAAPKAAPARDAPSKKGNRK
ncbi:hypothetical protein SDC9_20401 [bioreactor metagenome]|jgi:hypothetical protein|uniref:Uncharacterized protein n=1 Tax=bioreactor metagenome TaxID=1076179 RepID=A0A644U6N2_9ZZZZ|nr:MAG: hypothetical protein ALMCE001_18860 [Methanocorpusculum sp. MCE]